MRNLPSVLISTIHGTIGDHSYHTRADRKLIVRPRRRKPTAATTTEGWLYCQDCVSLLDAYMRDFDYYHKQEWGLCTPRSKGTHLTWLGHYYQINIRRMLFGMPGLSYPPDMFRSQGKYWERDEAIPNLVGSGITLVITSGYDKKGTPFDEDTGDIPPPYVEPPPPPPSGCPTSSDHCWYDCPHNLYCLHPIDCCFDPGPPPWPDGFIPCPIFMEGCPENDIQAYWLTGRHCWWDQSASPCGREPYDYTLMCRDFPANPAGPAGSYWYFVMDRFCIEDPDHQWDDHWPICMPCFVRPSQPESCPCGQYTLGNPGYGPWPPAHVPEHLTVYTE